MVADEIKYYERWQLFDRISVNSSYETSYFHEKLPRFSVIFVRLLHLGNLGFNNKVSHFAYTPNKRAPIYI